MKRRIILTATLFAFLAVILGAFGAHSLKNILTPASLGIWQKGIEYQFYHAFALLFLSTLTAYPHKLINVAFIFFSAGIVLFSGSLYLLAIKDAFALSWGSFLGPITPLGGLCFIGGWISMFLAALKNK